MYCNSNKHGNLKYIINIGEILSMNINDKVLKPISDIIAPNLYILFVGYNPGIRSAETGYHYAGGSNRFWKLLYESGLTPYKLKPEESKKLLLFGFGSTNIVSRPTKSSAEITASEYKEGAFRLKKRITSISPRIVCYVGIGVYREFASAVLSIPKSKLVVAAGRQSMNIFDGSIDYVCSNPSGLNTIPYEKQLDCFKQLKELLEHVKQMERK